MLIPTHPHPGFWAYSKSEKIGGQKSTFSENAQKNFKNAPKGVEISTTPKIWGGARKKCCKKLLATKNVVFQHLLLIYETIFWKCCRDFWPKMAIFGPPRQKFRPDAAAGWPISRKNFQKNSFQILVPNCAKYHGNPISSRDHIGGAVRNSICTRPSISFSMKFWP